MQASGSAVLPALPHNPGPAVLPTEEADDLERTLESDNELSGAESFLTEELDEDWHDRFEDCFFSDDSDDSDDSAYTQCQSSTCSTPPAAPQLPLRRESTPRRTHTRGRRQSIGSIQSSPLCRSRSRSLHHTTPEQHWKTESDPDVPPVLPGFAPARPPGVQLDKSAVHSPLELFQLFFSTSVVRKLCSNTNKQATKRIIQGLQFKWTDVTPQELLKYISLVIFMGLLKLGSIKSYWRQKNIFSVPFPGTVMARDRWLLISSNLRMSDPAEDAVNDSKKGSSEYDPLFRLKPLMTKINAACKSFYQPRKNLAIDERMVATEAKTGMTQYMKHKPAKCRFKLFILADSSNGYTSNFIVYTGKSKFHTGFGRPYDAVVGLLDKLFLGNGYHIYCDHVYTSPQLFRHLSSLQFRACGTYRAGGMGAPTSQLNALTKKSPRGSIRWIRDGDLLFVKWMDSSEVSIYSTIHQAYTSDAVMRRLKTKDGTWKKISVPIPTPIVEYNKHMGGVDLSDHLIQCTTSHHKATRLYKTMFLHFLDIAACNSYILHKELCTEQKTNPLTHRAFMEELTAQLAGATPEAEAAERRTNHTPVPFAPFDPAKPENRPTDVRKYCDLCKGNKAYNKTSWQCGACLVPLCNQLDRTCFTRWHDGMMDL
ncbi:piggyBac transposable element-derived protein 4-like isoform X2 [Esox lucius]|uniref:piggyBac transposable element-derived protein 4-like isoform X2 n=1 Tax=Esox lucius TaxID=8010 RepID=UPI001476C00E|nr:piggyBac transposable element-derived protein 4-like isoform X2 [Esox lucius]